MIVKFSDWQLTLVIGGIRHRACQLSVVGGVDGHMGLGWIFELGEVNAHEIGDSATNKQ